MLEVSIRFPLRATLRVEGSRVFRVWGFGFRGLGI